MTGIKEESYISLNALTQFRDEKGHYHFESDKEAVASYMEEVIAPRRINFNSLQERLDYLVQESIMIRLFLLPMIPILLQKFLILPMLKVLNFQV